MEADKEVRCRAPQGARGLKLCGLVRLCVLAVVAPRKGRED